MDDHVLNRLLVDFQFYADLLKKRHKTKRLLISGGHYDSDKQSFSRAPGYFVHYDKNLKPKKIVDKEMNVTYLLVNEEETEQ